MPDFPTDPGEFQVLSRLLDEALDLPESDRAAWIERLAPEHEALKPKLRELLSRERSSAGLGTMPKIGEAGDERPPTPARGIGDTVGPYRLLRVLGEGGMGMVWLAERTDGMIKRPVALKLPRRSRRQAALAERMAREREILATLEHPNIARLYDAGLADDGQPFLALEFVEGRPIDVYCEEEGIGLDGRLALFLQVVDAVAHAHAKLVIHRDVKPSNILVTAEGQVRLLDFGIAKLIDEGEARESALTEEGGRALTPDYASPEQISGEPITIGSDVYSLGVLLFELLTGNRPYRLKRDSRGALEDAIVAAEPARPSDVAADPRMRKALRGDLDTIVLHALRKDPAKRYPTVNAFGDDVRRHRQGWPVEAQPDRLGYRLSKFVRRNKLAVAAAAAVAVALLAGAVIAGWQASVALAEKRRAEQVKEFIASIFRDVDPFQRKEGSPVTAADILNQARARIEKELVGQPEVRAELLRVVGTSLMGISEEKSAEEVFRLAVAECERTFPPGDPETLLSRLRLAEAQHYLAKNADAKAGVAAVLDDVERHSLRESDVFVRAKLAEAMILINEGKAAGDEAEAAVLEAIEVASRIEDDETRNLAQAHRYLADIYRYKGKNDLSCEHAEKAFRTTLALHHGDRKHPEVLQAQNTYGRALSEAGKLGDAVANLKEAATNGLEVYGPHGLFVQHLVGTLGNAQVSYGELDEAIDNIRKGMSMDLGEGKVSPTYDASRYLAFGRALLAARRAGEAVPVLLRSKEGYAAANATKVLPLCRADLALAFALEGKLAESQAEIRAVFADQVASAGKAIADAARTRSLLFRLQGKTDPKPENLEKALTVLRSIRGDRLGQASVLNEMCATHLANGEYGAALETATESRDLLRSFQKEVTPAQADALVCIGRANAGLGKPAEALAALEEADTFWKKFDAGNRFAGEAALWLGRCYASLGRSAEAGRAFERAVKVLSSSPIPSDASLVRLAREG